MKLRRSDRHARPLPTLGLRGAATSHKGRRAGSRPARATILSCRLSSMAERCVVAAEMLDRYRQAVPDIGRVAHRQSGGLQNRVREGSIPSSPANLRAPAGLSPKTLKVTAHNMSDLDHGLTAGPATSLAAATKRPWITTHSNPPARRQTSSARQHPKIRQRSDRLHA